MVTEGKLTTGHARALITIESQARQIELAQYAAKEEISVREMEKLAQTRAGKKKPLKRKKSSDIAAVEDELKSILGTKVQLKMSGTKGKLEIQCFNREELERIVELLRSLA